MDDHRYLDALDDLDSISDHPEDIGRKVLIAQLEGIFHNYVINNGKKIRYPISFGDDTEIRGKYTLKVSPDAELYFFSGEYKFGANSLKIYMAIDALLKKLSKMGLLNDSKIDDLEESLFQEFCD